MSKLLFFTASASTGLSDYFFKDTSGRAIISSADGVRMEVGSTKLEQVFKQPVNTLSVFPCSGGWGQGYSDPNQHK